MLNKRLFSSFLCFILISNISFLSAKPKEKNTEDKTSTGVYKKYIHPREYIFDLSDAKNKVSLKVDSTTGKAYCNVDFTDLVREQMPRKGDKITFTYEGSASKDVESITATVYDLTKGTNIGNKVPEIFTTAVAKKENFKKSFSLILKDDAEKDFSLRLTGILPESKKKVDKIDLSFKRVTESTNTKKEAEEEKLAIKNGLKIVRVKSNFTVVEKKVAVKVEEPPAPEVEKETVEEKVPEVVEETAPETVAEITEEVAEEVAEIQEITVAEEVAEVTENVEPVQEEPVVEEAISEEEMIEVPELEPVQQKIVIKIEPEIVPEPVKSPVVETPSQSDSTYEPIIVKTKVSRYEKEYLQDFAVMDEFETEEPEAEEEVTKIINPDEKNKSGKTKLMLAAKNGDKDLIKRLISSGADVNMTDNEGWTALMYAARYQKDLSCFDLLLDSEVNVRAKNKYGLSALILAACYNSNHQILERIIKYYSPSEREVMKGFVLLLTESPNSDLVQLEKTKVFLDYSIPLNAFYNGKTPLMYACEYCSSTKIIRALLENNAKTEIRSTEGKTAFDYASSNSKLEHDNVYWTLNKK